MCVKNEKYIEAFNKVSEDYKNLELLPKEYRDNEDIVYEAIYQDGYALKWASPRLRDDKNIVVTALSSKYLGKSEINSKALQFASKRLRDDDEVVIESLTHNWGNGFQYASERIRSNQEMAFAAIVMSETCFQYLTPILKKDRDFVLKAMKISCLVYQYLPEEFKTDKQVILEGFKSCQRASKSAEMFFFDLTKEMRQEIKEDRALLKEIIGIDGRLLPEFYDFDYKNNNSYITDKELILIAAKTFPDIIIYADNNLKTDKDILDNIDF